MSDPWILTPMLMFWQLGLSCSKLYCAWRAFVLDFLVVTTRFVFTAARFVFDIAELGNVGLDHQLHSSSCKCSSAVPDIFRWKGMLNGKLLLRVVLSQICLCLLQMLWWRDTASVRGAQLYASWIESWNPKISQQGQLCSAASNKWRQERLRMHRLRHLELLVEEISSAAIYASSHMLRCCDFKHDCWETAGDSQHLVITPELSFTR